MLRPGLNHQIAGALALALLAVASTGTAAPPGIDTETSSPVTTVSSEELERLPTGRNIADLIRTCPSQTIPTVASGPRTMIDGVPTTPTPSIACIQPDDLRMVQVYQLHNSERARYGYQPLVWNPVLAANAQTYANQLAQTGQLAHASREGRGTERENLSQGLPGWTSYQLMGSWLDERPYFKAGIFPDVSTTGDWYQVGHYSQMIWPTTTDLGCGISAGGAFSWLVCRYNPGGNKDGKPVGFPVQQVAMTGDGASAGTQPFVNDRWRLNENWSFNMGTRYEETAPQTGQRASLFDLGIYAGGAWTSDWFNIQGSDPVIDSTNLDQAAPRIADILLGDDGPALNHDYGYDGGLFVGYDLGAFRLEAEVPYRPADQEPSPPPESLLDDIGDATPPPAGKPTWTGLLNNVLDTPSLTHPLDTTGYIFLDSNFLSGHGISFIPNSAPYFLSSGSFGESCPVPTIGELSYLDLVLAFRVGDDYSLRTGEDNLLDRNPPMTNAPNQYPNYYDALGRYIFAGCRLDF